jgi:phosphoribosyl-ATP pyrophosphohydrolase
VRKVSGKSNDEDLLIYEQLTDADFKKLSEKYGEESVEKYIKTMEARRMKNAS